jgi:hypothetical protein
MNDLVNYLVLYFGFLMINFSIAAYSFEYYALKSSNPMQAIERFQLHLKFPFDRLFKERLEFTLWIFANSRRDRKVEDHLKKITIAEVLLARMGMIIFSSVTLILPTWGFLQTSGYPLYWKCLTFIYILAYSITLLKCITFGREMAQYREA